MYSRESTDGPRTFGVSGKLWHGVLVMYDAETDSLWTQIDGRAVRGSSAGERLEHYPSVYTTWATWRAEHPDTLVLEKGEDEREQGESNYADYFADPDRLYFEHLGDGIGGIGPKDVVFGVSAGDDALAVSEALLESRKIVNSVVGGIPVAWLRDTKSGAVHAVDRRLADGRVLILEPSGSSNPALLFDDSLTGERHGTDELRTLRVDRSFWYAWARSHRGSRVLAN